MAPHPAQPEWQERRAAQGAAAWQIDKKQAPELHARLCALWAPLTEQAPPLDRIAALLSTLAALQSQETLLRPVGQRLEGRGTGVGLDGTDDPRRMEQLLRWVHQQWNRDLPLETAAAHLHLTPGAFSRAFKRRLGITFVRYVNDLRIARACMALLQTDRPIARIAEDCGYASLSHFQQQFQARKGTTPSSYRGSVQHRETHRHAGDAPASKRQQLRR